MVAASATAATAHVAAGGSGPGCKDASAGAEYGFPFPAYPLQRELMAKVYGVLERGGIGIFESPTGTGKTLALLAPALAWQRERERALLGESLLCQDDVQEDWAREHQRTLASAVADKRWAQRRRHREDRRDRNRRAGALGSDGKARREKAPRTSPADWQAAQSVDGDFSLEAALDLPQPDLPTDEAGGAAEDLFEGKLQIIYCSRTHSQLAQVLHEIKTIKAGCVPDDLSVVTLGARTHLCIHDGVRARANGAGHLNDLCKKATENSSSVGGCTLKKQAHVMTDAVLSAPMDIEGMVQRGRASVGGGCPYYGSRRAAGEADVLLVPYASLVNTDMRRKLGLSISGNVLIFDEAHNLLEAINDANSVTITELQARSCVDDLELYISRYEARLASRNAMRLRQFKQFCFQLHNHLAEMTVSKAHSVGGFLVDIGADHFDLPELSRFLEETELPRKVRGYSEAMNVKKQPPQQQQQQHQQQSSASIYVMAELLRCLFHSTTEDRILCQARSADGGATVRYLSLDAEARFRSVVDSARAIIFAGGTLEPRAEFEPLYSGLGSSAGPVAGPAAEVAHFAGRHIVPGDHLLARFVTHGPSGHALDFRKDARGTSLQLSELHAILASVARLTPGGVVVFFPSFECLASMAPPSAKSPGMRLAGRSVFVEKRAGGGGKASVSSGASAEATLRAFAATVCEEGGAVLLAVSGGKLSEGINFKDDLCRLVVVVGLPYPNATDLGLITKMRYLDARRQQGLCGLGGREFYSARCMKAVNQCIGRSIRHSKDWAAILMLDHRYGHQSIQSGISRWIREQAQQSTYPHVESALGAFFATRAGKRSCGMSVCVPITGDGGMPLRVGAPTGGA